MAQASEAPKRRRGRPRKTDADRSDVEAQVLAAATELFRTQGYQQTTMTQIAKQVGLDQSSLYYYFPSKERILNKVYSFQEVRDTLAAISELECSNVVKLILFVIHDVVAKCDLPFDFFEFETVANNNPEAFNELFETYGLLYQSMLKTMEDGIESGEFAPKDPAGCVVGILSVNEGLQHHYHAKIRGELILEGAGYEVKDLTPEQIGLMSASVSIPRLLATPSDLTTFTKEGMQAFAQLRERLL